MSKKILFVNQASYKTSDDSNVLEHRKKWIVQGLQSLKLVERHFDKCDVIFMDNTVDDITELPEEIQQNFHQSFNLVLNSSLNKFGAINSGAGNLEMIKFLIDKLDQYEFYVHHEPRTVIKNTKMFDSFFDDPRNYFRIGSCIDAKDESQFWTGTYFISTKDLKHFLEWADLEKMCSDSISIEYYIKDFFDKTNTTFDFTTEAGILWNDRGYNTNVYV